MVGTGELFEGYRAFCDSIGVEAYTHVGFGRALSKLGFETLKTDGRRYRVGLTLKPVEIEEGDLRPPDLSVFDANMKPVAPAHLTRSSAEWWERTVQAFGLEEDEEALRILTAACEQFDNGQAARVVIDREGILSEGVKGQAVEHPAVKIQREAHKTFARLLRELGLDGEAPADGPRIPRNPR